MTDLKTPGGLDITPAAASAAAPTALIRPARGWASLGLKDLWHSRELLLFLTWRDVKVRYKQTLLGACWAVIQPLATMVIFTIFLGSLAKVPSDGVPYPVFAFAALVPWFFFANGVSQGANSLVMNANLISKVYFPRLIIPIASVLGGLVDLAIAFTVLVGFMFYFSIAPTGSILYLPLLALLAAATTLGVSLWLAALNVRYRDVRHVVPFLVQFWMFATPVVYPSSLLPEGWRLVYALNPMVGVVDGFRWALLGATTPPGPEILVSTGVAVVLLATGALYFRRAEKTFADEV